MCLEYQLTHRALQSFPPLFFQQTPAAHFNAASRKSQCELTLGHVSNAPVAFPAAAHPKHQRGENLPFLHEDNLKKSNWWKNSTTNNGNKLMLAYNDFTAAAELD